VEETSEDCRTVGPWKTVEYVQRLGTVVYRQIQQFEDLRSFQREMKYIHLALMLRCQCPSDCPSVRLSVTEVHWVAVHAGKKGGTISRYASHC